MKTYYCAIRLNKAARKAIENVIATNDKYTKNFSLTPGLTSGNRRGNEERFKKENPSFIIKDGWNDIEVFPFYSETSEKISYSLYISVDKKRKDIEVLERLLKK